MIRDPDSGRRRTDVVRDDLTAASDPGLVLALARFQQEALGEVYRRHAGAVFGLAKRILSDQAKAEEVVQEVFLRLWNHPERFDPERGTLRSYLLAQAHSRAVDVLRSDVARRKREERDAREAAESGYDLDRAVWDLALAEHVRAAMQRLHPGERAAVELAYFGGRTYREVALELGEPEGTVKSRIRNGLKRLRAELVASGVTVGDA
ncbi:MAG: sigma-70 family RNA polymerase sigma factor [Actinobacteria bacterium]|jgi:RNA polymerase sigma-70 factor (ECF subfamily)|nr:sigma-70 family RNA polymerase sigma factor [Actinomycetota bacterium]